MNLTIVDVFRILMRNRRLIAISPFVVGVLFATLSAFSPKVYLSEVKLAPSNVNSLQSALSANLSFLGSIPGLGGSGYETQHLIAIATSDDFVISYLRRAGLIESMKQRTGFAALLERMGLIGPANDGDAIETFLADHFTVAFDDVTGIVTFRILANDPAIAAQQANEITTWFNQRESRAAAERARRSIALLQQEALNTAELETRAAIFRLIEAQYQTAVVAEVGEGQGFRILAPALAPFDVESPKPVLAFVIGFVLGGILSAGAAILRELWRSLLENLT